MTAAISTATASEITLYRSFAEIREAVKLSGNKFDWTPGADLANFLVPGSLALEYSGVLSQTLVPPPPSLMHAFEGKELFLRQGDKLLKAKVIRADQNLVQVGDQYMQVNPSDLVYPTLEGVRFAPSYSFALTGAGGNTALSYLTRGLSWSPRYNLGIVGDTTKLESWADVTNQTGLDFRAPSLTLVAGEVQLVAGGQDYGTMADGAAPRATMMAKAASPVQAAGEASGLQLFKYANPVVLADHSSQSLRFLEATPKLERIVSFERGFDQSAKIVVPLSRSYNFKADTDLPGGIVTVREDNRVVGQAYVQDTPKGEDVNLNLGADFDLRLTRTAQQLERTKTTAKYKVTLSLTNNKKRPVNIRLREYLGNNWTLDQAVLPNLKKDADGYTANATLAADARLEASYVVSFKY